MPMIYGNVVGSSKKVPVNINGTVYSTNADYAEIGEWADGNPSLEDRIGYFVAVDTNSAGTTMIKATSAADVRGVTVTSPAFAGGHTDDKIDSNGNLLLKYAYVAVMGLVPVIDNGTCTVNGRCMPADDGTAIPSTNNLGYQVIERIDDIHVLVAVEPGVDMIQRIKDDIDAINDNLDDINDTENGILKQAKDYADTKDSAIAAAKKSGDDAQTDVDTLEAKVGAVADGTTVVDMISEIDAAYKDADITISGRVKTIEDDYLKAADKTELSNAIDTEKTRAEGIEKGLRTDVNAVSGKVTTLIGSDSSKSARTIASEEVAKIVAGADASYDTLKEIADWISSHTTDAAAMNSAITTLESIVDGIGGEGEKATVVAYVNDAISALKIGDYAKAADLTALAARVKAIEDKNISTGANKVEKSDTNGNIKIDGVETAVYTHPGTGTNPHGTDADDVGAVPNTRTINNKVLNTDITLTADDVGAVPNTRKINDKALSSDITLSASDVGARPNTWTPSKSDIGLSNVGNFKAVSTVANQGLTEEEKAAARANIGAGASSFSGSYNDLTDKPTIPDAYELPTGSATVKGGFKVGAGLTVDGDVLSATGGGSADSVDWSNIKNKPTEFTPAEHTHAVIIEQNKGLAQKFWRGTQSEYNAIETKADDTMYIITDDEGEVEGTGDMNTSVYDPRGIATDIFAYVDDQNDNYYTMGEVDNLLNEKIPATRKINGKALSSDITLSAEDVGARSNTWTPTASDIGAVNKAGDTMTGALFDTLDNIGRASFVGNQHAAYLEALRSDYGTRRQIILKNIEEESNDANALLMWNSVTAKIYTILHTGNKFLIAPKVVQATLNASSWDSSSKTQTVTVNGISADETAQLIIPTPAMSSQTAYYEAGILLTAQASNSLTFTAKTVPTANLTVYIAIQDTASA